MRGNYNFKYAFTATITAARTLMYYTAPSTIIARIREVHITNLDNETNEQLEAYVALISSLGTPTATTITAAEVQQGDQTAAGTCKANVTASEPTYSASQIFGADGFPSLSGYHYEPLDRGPTIAPSASYGIYLATTSFTAFKPHVRLVIEELG